MAVRRAGHDLGLLDALADIPETVFDGEFWRAVHGARSPLDGSKGAGRWNLRESEVLYCALERDGALSEIFFHINRQQSVFPSRLRSAVYRMRAGFGKVIDLSDMELLRRLGVDPAGYREILYRDTQRIGEAVGTRSRNRRLGRLAPEARRGKDGRWRGKLVREVLYILSPRPDRLTGGSSYGITVLPNKLAFAIPWTDGFQFDCLLRSSKRWIGRQGASG